VGQLQGTGCAPQFALYRSGESVHRVFRQSGKRRKAFRFLRLFLAAVARVSLLLCMKPLIGSMAYSSAPAWPAKLTAAATGNVGVVRRDPHGYAALLRIQHGRLFSPLVGNGQTYPAPTKIFHVNWFRRGADGKFLWPGYGENVRVLKWILERVEGRAGADENSHWLCTNAQWFNPDGLQISPEAMDELLRVNSKTGRRPWPTPNNFSTNSAIACPTSCAKNHESSRAA